MNQTRSINTTENYLEGYLQTVLYVSTISFSLLLVPGLIKTLMDGNWYLTGMLITNYLVLLLNTLVSGTKSRFRAVLLGLVFYTAGILALYLAPNQALSQLLWMLFIVVSAIFLGQRTGIIALGVSMITGLTIGWLATRGVWLAVPGMDTASSGNYLWYWITSSAYLFLSAIILITSTSISRHLAEYRQTETKTGANNFGREADQSSGLEERYSPSEADNQPVVTNKKSELAQTSWKTYTYTAGEQDENLFAYPTIQRRLTVREKWIGELILEPGDTPWSEEELQLIDAIAGQTAQALETARLLLETQQQARRERLTTEIVNQIRKTNDPQIILNTALQELSHTLGLKSARLVGENGQILAPSNGNSDSAAPENIL
jgi:hypothetical protein